MCELAQFCENKNPCDPISIGKWNESLRVMMTNLHTELYKDGFSRYDPRPLFEMLVPPILRSCDSPPHPKNKQTTTTTTIPQGHSNQSKLNKAYQPMSLASSEKWQDHVILGKALLPFIRLSVTGGTTGGWLKTVFPSMTANPDTKREFLTLYLAALNQDQFHSGIITFHRAIANSCSQLMRDDGFKQVLLHVYSKNESVSVKKLLEGRHRSIQMPDWTFVILERACCAWFHESDPSLLLTHDDVYSRYGRFSENPLGGWCFGREFDSDLIKALTVPGSDLDVSGWDKSLPFELVITVYRETFHPAMSKMALNCAKGYNGYGIFKITDRLYRLPYGCTAWSSGCLNTLCGNSMIHSALLQIAGVDHVVMGDDANIFSSSFTPKIPSFVRPGSQFDPNLYTSVGLKLKKIDSITGFTFCKRVVRDGTLSIDWDDIRSKILASEPEQHQSRVALLQPSITYYNKEFGVPVPSWAV